MFGGKIILRCPVPNWHTKHWILFLHSCRECISIGMHLVSPTCIPPYTSAMLRAASSSLFSSIMLSNSFGIFDSGKKEISVSQDPKLSTCVMQGGGGSRAHIATTPAKNTLQSSLTPSESLTPAGKIRIVSKRSELTPAGKIRSVDSGRKEGKKERRIVQTRHARRIVRKERRIADSNRKEVFTPAGKIPVSCSEECSPGGAVKSTQSKHTCLK